MNVAGFSGTVATGWVGAFQSWIAFRLLGGAPSGGIAGVSMQAVPLGQRILIVGCGSGRRCYSGPMIRFSSPFH